MNRQRGSHSLSKLIDYKHETFKRNNNFGTFAKLFDQHIDPKECNDRERQARVYVRYIIKRFFHHVIVDMIKNNVEFVFPYKVFYLSIRSRKVSSSKYKFDIETGGHDYIPFISVSKHKKNILRRVFNLKLAKPYDEMLKNEVKSGHRYSDAPPTYYK